MTARPDFWKQPAALRQVQIILDSHLRWLGANLVPRSGSPELDAEFLFQAPFIVVSHDTAADPVLNYGNRAALQLWEAAPAEFLKMPSRLTAESVAREERQQLLDRTTAHGYVDDYSGVRITTSGRRFFIPKATVFNLIDEFGAPAGQAASFTEWEFLA